MENKAMTIPEKIARAKELSAEKATEYLAVGGLFNPELMEHDKVRDMVMAFHTLLPAMANALESEHNRANNAEAEVERLKDELDWQNKRNSGHPTRGGFEFYINEEWTGLAHAAIDQVYGWHASLRKNRTDPDDERVRVRRVIEDDAILAEVERLQKLVGRAAKHQIMHCGDPQCCSPQPGARDINDDLRKQSPPAPSRVKT